MTLLAAIVDASTKVAATSARLGKVRELASCLRSFAPDEIVVGVAYLSGETPQGKTGIGYAALEVASATAPSVKATCATAPRLLAYMAARRT